MLPSDMNQHQSGNGNPMAILSRESRKKPATPASKPGSMAGEDGVSFKTSEQIPLRGTVARIQRHAMVCELYSPKVIPRLSESLTDFKIILQGREVYSGHAIVNNIVDAGTKIICETSLDLLDWADLDLLVAFREGQAKNEIKDFLDEWQKGYRIIDQFKIAIANMQTFLHDLQLLLDRTELRFQAQSQFYQEEAEQKVLRQLAGAILPLVDFLFERFEEIAKSIPDDDKTPYMNYMRQHLHPLVLSAPFANSTFLKPRGYAGDFEMVNMIDRNGFEGESLFAKILHRWFVQQPPAQAHRNRIKYMTDCIEKEVQRVIRHGRSARILNFACGPAIEVQKFASQSVVVNHAEFTLQDFDEAALTHAERALVQIFNKRRIDTMATFNKKSIFQLIKDSQGTATSKMSYDLVYCAGLFDYLVENTCKQLTTIFYDMVLPGGLLIVTNVHSNNPLRYGMEHLLDWHLIYRSEREMRALVPGQALMENVSVHADETGVNLFLKIRKPDHA
jgi:extracellular factor (EF) 3-hydroxypalmitic acid methyl ester biosynthesis protein